jgi:hypothetical protein
MRFLLPIKAICSLLTSGQALKTYFRAMKWFSGLLLAAVLFTACDNDLVVTDTWEDIPVVWGLLSKADTAHYIRVEKAFLDPSTSALEIAQRVDSLYYEDATVSLRRVSSGQVFPLDRINGDLEGYPRDGGIFANTPNYLYKIRANEISLVIGEEYELIIDRQDGSAPVTARTIVLGKPALRNLPHGQKLAFKPKAQFTFNWDDVPDAGIYDVLVIVHYRERSPETGGFYVPKTFEWVVERNQTVSESKFDGTEFFAAMKENIAADQQATRLFDSLDVVIWCAGEELATFITIANANFGLTSTQDIPTYTNISEGVGLFSSRNVSVNTGYGINDQALDTLRDGILTKNLNFQ